MNIQTINGIVSGATAVYGTVKDFALWGGHKIQLGFTNYIVPTIKTLWAGTLATLKTVANFLRTGPGLTLIAATGLFAFGIAALRMASQKDYDEQEHKISQTAWKAIGAASIAASAVAAIGIVFVSI